MGIYISTEKAEELKRLSLEKATQAVADYRKPGVHSIGYDQATVEITDGAKVEVITICYHPNRLKESHSSLLKKIYELLESEA